MSEKAKPYIQRRSGMEKNNTIMAQKLQIIPRYEVEKAVKQFEAEKHSKGFSS